MKRQVAIYGKGGIGKSTTTQNTVAALAEAGKKIMVVGCDPKADSTRLLLHGLCQKTVLDTLRDEGDDIELDAILKPGFGNTDVCGIRRTGTRRRLCRPGDHHVHQPARIARGIHRRPRLCLLRCARRRGLRGVRDADPGRKGRRDLYRRIRRTDGAVCSKQHRKRYPEVRDNGKVRLGGIICNSRKVDNERPLLEAFAKELGSQLIYFVPRDNLVQRAEINKKTVIDFDPTSGQANEYRNLAKAIDENKMFVIPKPMTQERLEELMMQHGFLDAM